MSKLITYGVKFSKKLVIFFVLAIGYLNLYGQLNVEQTSIPYNQITTNAELEINSTNNSAANRKLLIKLSYKNNDRKNIYNKLWSYKIFYQLYSGSSIINEDSLEIKKTNNYDIFQTLHEETGSFQNCRVSIINVKTEQSDNIPDSIFLSLTLISQLNVSFNTRISPQLGRSDNRISWNSISGAEEYDIEFVFIDSLSKTSLTEIPDIFLFKEPVRITTENLNYPIDTIFPAGSLFYRVRAVSLEDEGEYTFRKSGKWSNNIKINLFADKKFQTNHIWQYNINYAEHGKKKNAMIYYDGTMRQRQSLTSLNTDTITIIQENLYDKMGRSAISFLPTPIHTNNLKYNSNFNLNSSGNKYSYQDIDYNHLSASNNSSGAAKYYSEQNEFLHFSHRDYIPNGQGYPFSAVQYTNDPTNRIRKQSDIGEQLMINNDHDYQYLYGGTSSSELIKLFGANSGKGKYFQRNIERDPNAQSSVAYLDNADRVVATALVGVSPDSLDTLKSYKGVEFKIDLSDNFTIDEENQSRTVQHNILCVEPSSYDFRYSLTGINFCLEVPNLDWEFCSECEYQIEIYIKKQNGDSIILNHEDELLKVIIDTLNYPGSLETECSEWYKIIKFSAVLNYIGETYTVVKKLSLLSGTVEQTILTGIEPGIRNIRDNLEEEYYSEIDSSNCIFNCDNTCSHLGEGISFIDCVEECENIGKSDSALYRILQMQCSEYNNALKVDVSPGGWMYENIDTLFKYARKADNPIVPWYLPLYSGPISGVQHAWREEWINPLIEVHPEKCFVDMCAELIESSVFDLQFILTQDYKSALDSGYLNPLGFSEDVEHGPPFTSNHGLVDPYFKDFMFGGYYISIIDPGSPILIYPIRLYKYRRIMHKSLFEFFYDEESDYWVSVWDFIRNPDYVYNEITRDAAIGELEGLEKCIDISEFVQDDSEDLVFRNEVDSIFQWMLFKGIYIGLKNKVHEQILNELHDCVYYDSPDAHFPKPLDIETEEDALELREEVFAEYRDTLCKTRAEIWAYQLGQECDLNDEEITEIETILNSYCIDNCDFGNPFGSLSSHDLDSEDPRMVELRTILGDCKAEIIATDSTIYVYDTICNQKCYPTLKPHPCLRNFLDFIETYLPVEDEVYIDILNNEEARRAFYCFDNLDAIKYRFLKIDELGIYEVSSTSSPTDNCKIAFFDLRGNQINLGEVIQFDNIQLQWSYPGARAIIPPEYEYGQIQLEILLNDGSKILGYIFNYNCGFIRTTVPDTHCEPKKRPSKCSQMLIAHLNKIVNDKSLLRSDIFECGRIERIEDANIIFLNEYGEDCILRLYDKSGTPIKFKDIENFIGGLKINNILPSELQEVEIVGLNYTNRSIKLRIKERGLFFPTLGKTIDAYLFSNCEFKLEDDCEVVLTCIRFPQPDSVPNPYNECINFLRDEADFYIDEDIDDIRTQANLETMDIYEDMCFFPPFKEELSYTYSKREHHYTLYYYDQAGNLVQSVPPEGVDTLSLSEVDNVLYDSSILNPEHRMKTRFRYNARNQVIERNTPDDGTTKYYYNNAGQLRFVHYANQQNAFQFMKYDNLSRIIITGEVLGITETLVNNNLENPEFPNERDYQIRHISRTIYDIPANCSSLPIQENVRGNVSASISESSPDNIICKTCYSYDPHGLVKTITQELNGMGNKRVDYEYDLISGNINAVYYQKDSVDQFTHKYEYDSDNRLVSVSTSRDGIFWHNDAKYFYYPHGPLARVEMGEQQVQGVDYIYTLQGWLKGVNSNALKTYRDPGHDGDTLPVNNPHRDFAEDAYGFTLGYFPGDYIPIEAIHDTLLFEAKTSGSNLALDGPGLFNGNISHMVTALSPEVIDENPTVGYAYTYDQLYRLTGMKAHYNLDYKNNKWNNDNDITYDYQTKYRYDGNGNIDSLIRNGIHSTNLEMDSLIYHYAEDIQGNQINNRLLHVNDSVSADYYENDIDDQGTYIPNHTTQNNYAYDDKGNLIKDDSAYIEKIKWNVYGRIDTIKKTTGHGPDLLFLYDASQNRIAKVIIPDGNWSNSDNWQYNYYLRGLTGEIISTYKLANGADTLKDFSINGLQRLGLYNENYQTNSTHYSNLTGNRQYELTNHLGNVLSTFSDQKNGIDTYSNGQINNYLPYLFSVNDYYPFGSAMPNRVYNRNNYRFGFNGMEGDSSIVGIGNSYTTRHRQYDPRIGRWFSCDPLIAAEQSDYLAFNNNPILFQDKGGDDPNKYMDVLFRTIGLLYGYQTAILDGQILEMALGKGLEGESNPPISETGKRTSFEKPSASGSGPDPPKPKSVTAGKPKSTTHKAQPKKPLKRIKPGGQRGFARLGMLRSFLRGVVYAKVFEGIYEILAASSESDLELADKYRDLFRFSPEGQRRLESQRNLEQEAQRQGITLEELKKQFESAPKPEKTEEHEMDKIEACPECKKY